MPPRANPLRFATGQRRGWGDLPYCAGLIVLIQSGEVRCQYALLM